MCVMSPSPRPLYSRIWVQDSVSLGDIVTNQYLIHMYDRVLLTSFLSFLIYMQVIATLTWKMHEAGGFFILLAFYSDEGGNTDLNYKSLWPNGGT